MRPLLLDTIMNQYHRESDLTRYVNNRGVISTFSWRGQIFFNFSIPPDYWKIEKKQHFICSNLTLFVVPFFLFSLVSSLFFLFFFFLGGRATAPQPPQMTPLIQKENTIANLREFISYSSKQDIHSSTEQGSVQEDFDQFYRTLCRELRFSTSWIFVRRHK